MPTYVFRRPPEQRRIVRRLINRVPSGKAIVPLSPSIPPKLSPIDFKWLVDQQAEHLQGFQQRNLIFRLKSRVVIVSKRLPLAPPPKEQPLQIRRVWRRRPAPSFDYRALQKRLAQRTVPISLGKSDPLPHLPSKKIFFNHLIRIEADEFDQYNFRTNARRLKSGWSFIPIASKKYQHISVESLIEIPEYLTLIELPEYITLVEIPEYKTTRSLL